MQERTAYLLRVRCFFNYLANEYDTKIDAEGVMDSMESLSETCQTYFAIWSAAEDQLAVDSATLDKVFA